MHSDRDSHIVLSRTKQSLWDESLRIGIPVIDEQHEAMALCADKFLQRADVLLNSEALVDFLTEISRLMLVHFTTEELLLQQLAVPNGEKEAHIKAHTKMLDTITSISCDLMQGKPVARGAEIAPIIESILKNHVIEYDFALAKKV